MRAFLQEELGDTSEINVPQERLQELKCSLDSFVSQKNVAKVMLVSGEGAEYQSFLGKTIFNMVLDANNDQKIVPLYFKFTEKNSPVVNIPQICLDNLGVSLAEQKELKKCGKCVLIVDQYSKLGRLVNIWVSSKLYEWNDVKLICVCEQDVIDNHLDYKHFFCPIYMEKSRSEALTIFSINLLERRRDKKVVAVERKLLSDNKVRKLSLREKLEKHPLNQKLFVGDGVMQFWVDNIMRGGLESKHALDLYWHFVEASKKNESLSVAASNSISILVKSGINFSGKSLRKILIPKADLSGGYFDSADLSEANLENVKLKNAWLRKAKLIKCNMFGVEFGEYPIFKHRQKIDAMDYREDLNYLVTASDKKIYFWDIETYDCKILDECACEVTTIATTADGQLIIYGCEDGIIRIINRESGDCRDLIGHAGGVLGVFLDDEQKTLITGSRDNTIRVWDLKSGNCKRIYEIDGAVKCLTLSKKRILAVYVGLEGSLFLWSEHDLPQKLPVHLKRDLPAYIGVVNSFRLWNEENLQKKSSRLKYDISCAAFSPDGEKIAFGGVSGAVTIVNLETLEFKELDLHKLVVNSIAFSKDGNCLVSAGADKVINIWDMIHCSNKVMECDLGNVSCIAISDISEKVIFADSEGVTVREIENSQNNKKTQGHHGAVSSVSFTKNADLILSGGDDRIIRFWNLPGFQSIILGRHGEAITSLSFAPDVSRVASSDKNGVVRVWDILTKNVIGSHSYKNSINCVAISKNGRLVVSCGWSKIHVWNLMTNEHFELCVPGYELYSISISPDSRRLVSGGYDRAVRVWDLETKKEILPLCKSEFMVKCVRFSSQGNKVVFGSEDGTVRVWDLDSSIVEKLPGFMGYAECVKFSCDDKLVFAASSIGLVNVIDFSTHKRLSVIQVRMGVRDIDFHDESGRLVIGSSDGSIKIFQNLDNSYQHWLLVWFSDRLNRRLYLEGCDARGAKYLSFSNYMLLQQSGGCVDFNRKLKSKEEGKRSHFDFFEQTKVLQFPDGQHVPVDDDVHEYMIKMLEELSGDMNQASHNFTSFEHQPTRFNFDHLLKENKRLVREIEEERKIGVYTKMLGDDLFLRYQIANTLYSLGYIDQLIVCYKNMIKLDPNNTTPHHNLACCYHLLGELELAESHFKKTKKLKLYAGVHCEYGLFLYCQERCDEAVEEFLCAIKLAKDGSSIMFGKIEQPRLNGCLVEELNKRDMIYIKPVYLAYYYLIQCYLSLNDHVLLEKTLETFRILAEEQNDPMIYRMLGDSYNCVGDEEAAETYRGLALSLELSSQMELENQGQEELDHDGSYQKKTF